MSCFGQESINVASNIPTSTVYRLALDIFSWIECVQNLNITIYCNFIAITFLQFHYIHHTTSAD